MLTHCPHCGCSVDAHQANCPACKQPMNLPAAPPPSAGGPASGGTATAAAACLGNGAQPQVKKVHSSAMATTSYVLSLSPMVEMARSLNARICPACATVCDTSAIFCDQCGAQLANGAADPAADSQAARKALLDDHRDALRQYTQAWIDPDNAAQRNIAPGEAAYHVCLHAAMLYRYTANEIATAGLTRLPPEQRARLVRAACDYASRLTLDQSLAGILADDALETEEIEQVQDILLMRDGLEEVLLLSKRLSADLPDQDAVRTALAMPFAIAGEVDRLLLGRPDVVSVIVHVLDGLRRNIAVAIDPRRQWWFSAPAPLDPPDEPDRLNDLLED